MWTAGIEPSSSRLTATKTYMLMEIIAWDGIGIMTTQHDPVG